MITANEARRLVGLNYIKKLDKLIRDQSITSSTSPYALALVGMLDIDIKRDLIAHGFRVRYSSHYNTTLISWYPDEHICFPVKKNHS